MTRFSHARGDIATELTLGVPRSDAVKIAHLRITNHSASPRRLSLTSYVEWVLGADREQARHQLHTRYDAASGAVFAQNFFAPDFTMRVAFSWISETVTGYTARRDHFIGRNGDLAAPAALRAERLSGATGAGDDPCAALQCAFALAPGETKEIVILLGAAASDGDARALIERHGTPAAATAGIHDAATAWDERLGAHGQNARPDLDTCSIAGRCTRRSRAACGTLGALPIGRCVRIPRSAPGLHGVRVCGAGVPRERTCCRGPSVCQARAALVGWTVRRGVRAFRRSRVITSL